MSAPCPAIGGTSSEAPAARYPTGRFHNVKFTLEVDLDALPDGVKAPADLADELGRILRYWGGNMKHYQLIEGDASPIYNSGYHEVGSWQIT